MYKRLIINDLKKSKLSSLIILFFIIISSLLSSLVAITSTNLVSSINSLMDNTKAPHFIQMHQGEVDKKRIKEFVKTNPNIKSYQVLPFLNVNDGNIKVNGKDFFMNSQDNGFSYQSETFDFLLNLENKKIYPKEGEVYIPLSYYTNNNLKIGDILEVSGFKLIVKGPIRDIQMNSPLSSSKRFLVNPSDLKKIENSSKIEYLIEFRLNDLSQLSNFKGQYSKANLYDNGPTITYPIIRLVNALSEGILLLIIGLVAFFTLLISFLCIRFSLLAKIEEEYKNIAVLKCLGIPLSKIKLIYISKYLFISLVGSFIGLFIAILVSPIFLENIYLYLGPNNVGGFSLIISLLNISLIFVLVLIFINHLLRRFKKISPRDALKRNNFKSSNENLRINLGSFIFKTSTGYLTYLKLISFRKLFLSLAMILIISSFILIIPRNLVNTFKSDDFIGYMGIGNIDYIISSQTINDYESVEKLEDNLKLLDNKFDYNIINYGSYDIELDNNQSTKIFIGNGNHNKFPLTYQEGKAPDKSNEIAISHLLHKEIDKNINDELKILKSGKKISYKIVGIYSDITNGGMTGQINDKKHAKDNIRTSIYISNIKNDKISKQLEDLSRNHPEFRLMSVDEKLQETLGPTVQKMKLSSLISLFTAVFLILLISSFFTKLMLIRDRPITSILKSMGFSIKEISKTYYLSVGIVSFVSIILGLIINKVFGSKIVSVFMENIGIGRFKFLDNNILGDIFILIILIVLVTIGTNISLKEIKTTKVSDFIKE